MIPKKEWWCGCEPDITFSNEKEWLRHMKDVHQTWCQDVLSKLVAGK